MCQHTIKEGDKFFEVFNPNKKGNTSSVCKECGKLGGIDTIFLKEK
jgi:hypothetical protein